MSAKVTTVQDRDAEQVGQHEGRLRVPMRAVRRLLLDAVLIVEEADLRLEELGVVTLRGQLLEAASKLTLAANAMTNPGLLPDEGKR